MMLKIEFTVPKRFKIKFIIIKVKSKNNHCHVHDHAEII